MLWLVFLDLVAIFTSVNEVSKHVYIFDGISATEVCTL